MNISMTIDCTPEEARRFMGLPDMSPIHELYLDKLRETMNDGVSPEMLEKLVRAWTPMGDAGMNAWQKMIEQMTGTARA